MSTASVRSVAQALELAALESSHLAPSATLFLRRLRDPLPRRLLASPYSLMPSPAWETALRDVLDRCAHDAARPALGPVPSNANAVLFTDQAELLACLARDLVSGDATRLWWWTALRRSLPSGSLEALVTAWCRHAEAVPAAMEILARQNIAAPVINAISPTQTLAVVRAVAAAFETPMVLTLLAVDRQPERGAEEIVTQGSDDASGPRQEPVPPGAAAEPWSPFIEAPMLAQFHGVERQLLVGFAVALARAPARVRSREFLKRVAIWWDRQRPAVTQDTITASPAVEPVVDAQRKSDETSVAQPEASLATEPLQELGESPGPSPRRPQDDTRGGSHAPHPSSEIAPAPIEFQEDTRTPSSPQRSIDRVPRPGGRSTLDRARMVGPEGLQVPPVRRGTTPEPMPPTRVDLETKQAENRASAEIEPISPAHGDTPRKADAAWVATEIGGTFYLVTLLTRLDFFDSLERHFGCASTVGGWTWMELLARALLGPRLEEHSTDPLWRCLATLDGRESDASIGAGFDGADDYVLPKAWTLELFALDNHAAARDLGQMGVPLTPELGRFLSFLLPFFRWRLTHALHLDRDTAIAEVLLESPARVSVSATHVDVRFPIDAARPAVRLAGLDADPGWVPALGRVVRFEFV